MPRIPELPRSDRPRILRVLSRRRGLLLLPWGAIVLAGLGAALALPTVYSSRVTLLFESPPPASGSSSTGNWSRSTAQQAEIMRQQAQSDVFLRSVLEQSGQRDDPATRAWAARAARRYSAVPAGERAEAFLIDRLRRSISIQAGPGDVFRVEVEERSPEGARRLADAVAEQFVLSSKAAQLEAVRATEELSIEQQRLYRTSLEQSERRLEAYRAALAEGNAAPPSSRADLARARVLLERTDHALETQRRAVAEQRARLDPGLTAEDLARLDGEDTGLLLGQLKGLERQAGAALLSNDPTGDSGAVAREVILRKRSELEVKFIRNAAIGLPRWSPEVRDQVVRYRLAAAELEAAEARRAYLGAQVGILERAGTGAPDPQAELKRLTDEVENRRALYQSFLQELASAQIAQSFEGAKLSGRFSILAPATLPLAPTRPGPLAIGLVAALLGGVVGVGSVLWAERRNPSVMNLVEAESLLGLPVLGAVPRAAAVRRPPRRPHGSTAMPAAEPDPGLLHRFKVESPLGLEFRRIYLKLARTPGRPLPRSLLVTSSTRGEGKTLTAACLAITLAREGGEGVLLVDFDLRNPALHRMLGLPTSSWGLAQMLRQREFDPRFIRQTVIPGLDFLPAGKGERPPAELLTSEAIAWFVDEARSRYPLVLIDAAPSLAVPDPLILGRLVEGVLYVVKAGATMRRAAEVGVRVQREASDNLLGVVVNDAGDVLPHDYGYQQAYRDSSEIAGGDA